MKKSNFKLYGLVFFSVFFILNSCYTVKEQNVVDVERIEPTKKRMQGDYYNYKEKEEPSFNNPYSMLEVYNAGKYEYETNEKVEQIKVAEPGTFVMGGLLTAGATGWLFSNNTQWFSEQTESSDAFWVGALLGGITWWLIVKSANDEKSNYIFRPGKEYEFENEELLTNTDILVSAKGIDKTFTSNAKGLLRYSPPFDFQFESVLNSEPIDFILSKDGKNFLKPNKLYPSDWLKHYAKITSPRTPIKNKSSDATFGIAREGLLYEVLQEENDMVKIQFGSKTGWVDIKNTELMLSRHGKSDYSLAIKNYVTDEMQKWLKQGEFELPEDYVKRIIKKDEQLIVFTNQAMDAFQKEYSSYFDWRKSEISRYDPNSQTYKVKVPELDEYVIKVPIENAKQFKENWGNIVFKNQKFTLVDGNWELVSFEIEDKYQEYIARYDNKITNHYDPTNQFAFDFKDFEVEIPDLSVTVEKPIQVSEANEADAYSIKTDLPETTMSNPDAIAVVIGNAFYQKTASVNYAINDAQLMKLYLTKVLGFKEGNIIFAMNTTKAELEGLFGTDKNYKGKLFNYIKPQISDVFVFYSGHGAPDPNTKEAYFIPTDCDPSYVELQGYALKTFYKNLAQLPSKSITVVLDACFSGAGVLKNISSVRIKPKDSEANIKNSAVLSSSSGTQVSSWYNQKRHGMFTYFFLKAIHEYQKTDKNQDKKLTIKEIFDYVADKTSGVPYYARRLNAVDQNPVLKGTNTERVFVEFD